INNGDSRFQTPCGVGCAQSSEMALYEVVSVITDPGRQFINCFRQSCFIPPLHWRAFCARWRTLREQGPNSTLEPQLSPSTFRRSYVVPLSIFSNSHFVSSCRSLFGVMVRWLVS